MVYNAIYSSEFNPIERLWAFSKQIFGREMVAEAGWGQWAGVEALVRHSIVSVSPDSMRKYIDQCKRRIKLTIDKLKRNPGKSL